jgi:transposase
MPGSNNYVPLTNSIHWRMLHQQLSWTSSQIKGMRKYKRFSKATICRHMKKPLMDDSLLDKRRANTGRPRKLSARQERHILREAERLRETDGHFTIKRIKTLVGINEYVSDETVRRVFRKAGFRYSHSRKKGVLRRDDLRRRLEFAKKVRRLDQETLWKNVIGFYLDGVGFTHKYNPYDQARAPRSMGWRRPGDGLSFDRTARGSHEGTGGRVAHFMCAIAYGKGVIMAHQYVGRLDGGRFAEMVKNEFPEVIAKSTNPNGRMFLQDGDPSQNSRKAKDAFEEVGAHLFSIPARSPDLNPIENVFHVVKEELRKQALDERITRENFEQFSARCHRTLINFPVAIIDRTIGSMPRRIDMVIKKRGQRLKY